MKKLALFIMPTMTVSLLMSCGKANAVTITWKNDDGTVLKVDENVPLGTIPSYDGETPTKPKDNQYIYTFSGWSPEIIAATIDQTYTAQYSKDAIEYTVTFKDKSGDIPKTISADSLVITSPEHSTTEHYENGHWEDESGLKIEPGIEHTFTTDQLANRTFSWVESPIKYTITFVDKTGASDTRTITAENLEIYAPTHETTEHYESGRWEENGTLIGSGAEYTFQPADLKNHTFTWMETPIGYTITFKDKDGTVDSKTISAESLSIADSPTHELTTHYENGRWVDEDGDVIIPGEGHTFELDELSDHTFTWTEDPINYNIKFVDARGDYGTDTISVEDLKIEHAPTHSDSEYYTNGHWRENNIQISSDGEYTFELSELKEHTFTWTETPIEYKITFKGTAGETVDTKFINIKSLTITDCPTHSITTHHDGYWEDGNGLQILSGQATYPFTYDQLKEHTFTWKETIHNYKVKFVDSAKTIENVINLNDLTINAPEHSTTEHYENGYWEDESGTKTILSDGELTLTEGQLADYTFTWKETAIMYTITFVDDTGEIGTRVVSADSPTIAEAPAHSVAEHFDGYWEDDDIKIGSKEKYTFDPSDLANHTLTWKETMHLYDVIVLDDTGEVIMQAIICLQKTNVRWFPSHATTAYYENGHWEDESGIKVASGDEYTFNHPGELTDHTFTWIETAKQYTVTFNFIDGSKETRNISIENLQFTTPKTKAAASYDVVWKIDGHVLDGEVTKTLVASELKNYTYTETVATPYTITYHLDGGKESDPDNPNPTVYDITDKVTLKNPIQNEFLFSKWYLDEAKTNEFKAGNGWEPTSRTGNLVLYADWHSSTDLSKYSWKDIKIISDNGRPDKYFDIGDRRTTTTDDLSTEYTVRIIDFMHDDIADGSGKAGITFEFTNCYWTTAWDINNSCRDYSKSTINAKTEEVHKSLIGNLEDVIKTVDKKVAVSQKSREWSISSFPVKLFPLSCIETGDTKSDTLQDKEGSVYQLYNGDYSHRDAQRWRDFWRYWTRSPNSSTYVGGEGNQPYYIDQMGGMNHIYGQASDVCGLCPAFCI